MLRQLAGSQRCGQAIIRCRATTLFPVVVSRHVHLKENQAQREAAGPPLR